MRNGGLRVGSLGQGVPPPCPMRFVAPNKIGPYILTDVIGRGSTSLVKLAIHEQTGEKFACKIVARRKLSDEEACESFENEIRSIQMLSENKYFASLQDILKDSINFYAITELCPQGQLYDRISEKGAIPEDEVKFIFRQILMAIKAMHSIGIVHRDIKPENILISSENRIKIIDFGFSSCSSCFCGTIAGSTLYLSPEQISGKPYDGKKADIWSAGVTLFAMIYGKLPWLKRVPQQIMLEIEEGEFFIPITASKECRDLIAGLMTKDPSKRMTIDEALSSPWLISLKDDQEFKESMTTSASPVNMERLDVFFERKEDDNPLVLDSAKRFMTASARIIMSDTIKKPHKSLSNAKMNENGSHISHSAPHIEGEKIDLFTKTLSVPRFKLGV